MPVPDFQVRNSEALIKKLYHGPDIFTMIFIKTCFYPELEFTLSAVTVTNIRPIPKN